MGNGICENVCVFFVVAVRNARNKRNGNAAEIEKEKHILQPLVSDYIRSIV